MAMPSRNRKLALPERRVVQVLFLAVIVGLAWFFAVPVPERWLVLPPFIYEFVFRYWLGFLDVTMKPLPAILVGLAGLLVFIHLCLPPQDPLLQSPPRDHRPGDPHNGDVTRFWIAGLLLVLMVPALAGAGRLVVEAYTPAMLFLGVGAWFVARNWMLAGGTMFAIALLFWPPLVIPMVIWLLIRRMWEALIPVLALSTLFWYFLDSSLSITSDWGWIPSAAVAAAMLLLFGLDWRRGLARSQPWDGVRESRWLCRKLEQPSQGLVRELAIVCIAGWIIGAQDPALVDCLFAAPALLCLLREVALWRRRNSPVVVAQQL